MLYFMNKQQAKRGSPPSKTFDKKKTVKRLSSAHTLLFWVFRYKAGVRNVQ